MRLVQFLIGSYGGAEEFFTKLVIALSKRGIDQVLVCNDDPQFLERVKSTGLPFHSFKFRKGRDVLDRWRLRRLIGTVKPDIVMAWMNRAGRRVPDGPHVSVGRLGGYYPVSAFRRCHYLIANSPGILEHVKAQGWPADRVIMLTNFGELPTANAADRNSLGVPPGYFMILALGRFSTWKGFDHLIMAMQKIPNAILCLAGDGEERANLERLAFEQNVDERVRFLGWREDRAALLKAADLCVVPSTHEPLSNVILEAWSLGVPVVATASEGPRWLIKNGVTGLLAQPGQTDDLAEKICSLLSDAKLMQNIRTACHEKWRSSFSEPVICNQYIDFFESILRKREQF